MQALLLIFPQVGPLQVHFKQGKVRPILRVILLMQQMYLQQGLKIKLPFLQKHLMVHLQEQMLVTMETI